MSQKRCRAGSGDVDGSGDTMIPSQPYQFPAIIEADKLNGLQRKAPKKQAKMATPLPFSATSNFSFLDPCHANHQLTPTAARTWMHPAAAKLAAQHKYLLYRRLGCITRELTVSSVTANNQSAPVAAAAAAAAAASPITNPFAFATAYNNRNDRTGRKITSDSDESELYWLGQRSTSKPAAVMGLGQARQAAEQEVAHGMLPNAFMDLEERAKEIVLEWKELCTALSKRTLACPWDAGGDLDPRRVKHANYVPLHVLQQWIQGVALQANDKNDDILDELGRVLDAAADLAKPNSLWGVPLILAIPMVSLVTTVSSASKKQRLGPGHGAVQHKTNGITWRMDIGVYASRLLPEAMTAAALQVVMQALDPATFVVQTPLHHVPMAASPIFAISPTPKVVFAGDDGDMDDVSSHGTDKENAADQDRAATAADLDSDDACCYDDDSQGDGDSDMDKKPAAVLKRQVKEFGGEASTRQDGAAISAFSTRGLLRLLENEGNDVSAWPSMVEPKLQQTMCKALMLHQQHAVCWMLQMEQLPNFGVNSLIWEQHSFVDGGVYYYAPALGQLRVERPERCRGGILADEMGLGKTLEVLGLILVTLEKLKAEAAAADPEERATHATLIVVPPALVMQWINEILQATFDSVLTVDVLDHHTGRAIRQCAGSLGNTADVVVTTYNALSSLATKRYLNQKWGRIVLDEMQEIRSSTSKIAQSCEKLQSERRWMLSGTPLFEGVEDLRGELNFLRLSPFAANYEDGFFDFCISTPWEERNREAIDKLRALAAVMLRRSKSMTIRATGAPIMGLMPLTVEFVPIVPSESERALYYFMEYVVSNELRKSINTNHPPKSRLFCLRLLRELCLSPILLNGGHGAPSQLKHFNQLLLDQARRAPAAQASGAQTVSCDEAILFLAQIQEATRSGQDEVAFMQLGHGQGMARRARAAESVEEKISDAETALHLAERDNARARIGRSKLLWHVALELITTGRLRADLYGDHVSQKFRALWRFRGLIYQAAGRSADLPSFLLRGWRPSPTLLDDMRRSHPGFVWLHPTSILLRGIHEEINGDLIASAIDSIASVCRQSGRRYELHPIQGSASETWDCFVLCENEGLANAMTSEVRRVTNVAVPGSSDLDFMKAKIAEAKVAHDDAIAAFRIHQSDAIEERRRHAKARLKQLQRGVKISTSGDILNTTIMMSTAVPVTRAPLSGETSAECLQSWCGELDDMRQTVLDTNETMSRERRKLRSLRKAQTVADTTNQTLSAFEELQLLAEGTFEETRCPICLGPQGGYRDDVDGTEPEEYYVAILKCGHLFCKTCWDGYDQSQSTPQTPCPSCRKPIATATDVVTVDPNKAPPAHLQRGDVDTAKRLVQKASQMLAESDGQLDPDLWQQLYLATDIPGGVSQTRDMHASAVPGSFIAHLRSAVAPLNIHSKPELEIPTKQLKQWTGLSSKVKQLLRDLPLAERSVVFSSSKAAVQHVERVLSGLGIGCRALFSGQAVEASEQAMADWKADPMEAPVLVLQSGAAASGLTLTAACKIFLLEPFLRYEEELQAYARCHRYGQTRPVHVKCYFAPVSVESRLLAWRRRGAVAVTDMNVVYDDMDGSDSEDDVGDIDFAEPDGVVPASNDDDADAEQTAFLLGLHDLEGNNDD